MATANIVKIDPQIPQTQHNYAKTSGMQNSGLFTPDECNDVNLLIAYMLTHHKNLWFEVPTKNVKADRFYVVIGNIIELVTLKNLKDIHSYVPRAKIISMKFYMLENDALNICFEIKRGKPGISCEMKWEMPKNPLQLEQVVKDTIANSVMYPFNTEFYKNLVEKIATRVYNSTPDIGNVPMTIVKGTDVSDPEVYLLGLYFTGLEKFSWALITELLSLSNQFHLFTLVPHPQQQEKLELRISIRFPKLIREVTTGKRKRENADNDETFIFQTPQLPKKTKED
jgi:hypothetical protein